MQQPTIIARAFELARGGRCRTATDIRQILVREGYEHVHQHLMAPSVVKQLKKLIRATGEPAIVELKPALQTLQTYPIQS